MQGLAGPGVMRPLLLVLGIAILASWIVDRMLVREGMIGRWWGMLGLGGMTMLVGVVVG